MDNVGNEGEIMDLFERCRQSFKTRFRRENDWLRLLSLGIILVTFSALALADALAIQPIPGRFGGSSAIFGGIAIVLFVTKVAKGEVYIDWLLDGIFYVLAGIVLYSDENLTEIPTLVCICALLLASGMTRIWIGLTASPEEGATWLLSAGCVAALSGLWIVCAWILVMPTTAALVLALDTLFQGIAIAGFGISLKQGR